MNRIDRIRRAWVSFRYGCVARELDETPPEGYRHPYLSWIRACVTEAIDVVFLDNSPGRIGDEERCSMTHETPHCPYCDVPSRLVDSAPLIYENGYSQLVYLCNNWPDCDAYVGVHDGTDIPKGTLARRNLRQKRIRAHEAFDFLWRENVSLVDIQPRKKEDRDSLRKRAYHRARSAAYGWLEDCVGLPEGTNCHIGQMDSRQCDLVIRYCAEASPSDVVNYPRFSRDPVFGEN